MVGIEEGTELETNISNLKNELATLTAFMPTAEVVDESKVQIGTGKLKKIRKSCVGAYQTSSDVVECFRFLHCHLVS